MELGLTGRKIIVITYGGKELGGGACWKDCNGSQLCYMLAVLPV
jgi:S-adenosylmethionine synthetase